jgi:LytS/YehU family sensor histidine kinase
LINKNKELIPLEEELEFIESYFFLLQIRHDNKLQLQTTLDEKSAKVMIPPCSLQILVENAIKHNEFTAANPLLIKVTVNDLYLQVSNNIKPKLYAVNSTGIGLRNLSSRYKLLFKKDITIATTRENFIVKLPLIK